MGNRSMIHRGKNKNCPRQPERPSAHSSLTCGTGAGSWLSHWVVQCTECTVSCILHGCLYSALATVFPIWVPANGQKRSHRTSFFFFRAGRLGYASHVREKPLQLVPFTGDTRDLKS